MRKIASGRALFWSMFGLYFIFLTWQVLSSDYLLTDEADMLWYHDQSGWIVRYWSAQGRVLTGWLQQTLFSGAGRIAHIKYIRLFSAGGWMLATGLLFYILKRLQRREGLRIDDRTIYLTVAFMAASLSASIYIGWAVCAEVFIAVLCGLSAGLVLFTGIQRYGARVPVQYIGLFALLGLLSLFLYQTCYPFALLPFYCLFLSRKDGTLTRSMRIGLVYFFVLLAVYFLLYKWSLYVSGTPASTRTALRFNPLDRIGFFFSYPMNQAVHANVFFDTRSVISQTLFPVVMVLWLVSVFIRYKGRTAVNLRYVAGMIGWWMLGYLPQLIAQESDAAYRTMPVLSIMVFLMMADTLVCWLRERGGRAGSWCYCLLLILLFVRGSYVYYAYLSRPLRGEYNALRKEIVRHYTDRTRQVVFILADADGFLPGYKVRHFKDEFGMPSAYKDWTPDALVRQVVYERTGSHAAADALKVQIYAHAADIPDRSILQSPDLLYIDANSACRP